MSVFWQWNLKIEVLDQQLELLENCNYSLYFEPETVPPADGVNCVELLHTRYFVSGLFILGKID